MWYNLYEVEVISMSIVRDGIIGFALGNAMGIPVNGESRDDLLKNPVTNMIKSTKYDTKEGVWGFDTSQVLIMVDSLINMKEISYSDIAECLLECTLSGEYTALSTLFDIDKTVEKAIQKYGAEKDVTSCGVDSIKDNGNGALPRMIPLAFYCHYNHLQDNEIYKIVKGVTSITHMSDVSVLGSFILVKYILFILNGKDKYASYNMIKYYGYEEFFDEDIIEYYNRLLKTNINNLSVDDLKSEEYIVYTLETILWVTLNCSSSAEAIVGGVNLGGDTSSIAALCGALCGIIYGISDVPTKWLNELSKIDYIETLISKFENILNIYE